MKKGQLFRLGMPERLRHKDTMGEATGEFRRPRRGEWYISGAIPEAYQAPNDLTASYHIVRLVKVRQVVTVVREAYA